MKYVVGLVLLFGCGLAMAQDGIARPDVPGQLMIDFGFNYLDTEPDAIDQKGWPSKSASVYYVRRKGLSNKFSFYYGIGLGTEKLGLGDSATLVSGFDNGTEIEPLAIVPLDNSISYNKNKLAITYLDIPVDLRFHPLGTQDGEGLFFGVGGILGLRINSHTKFKFDEGGETVIEKVKAGYNLSTFRYGVQARFGFRGVHLFYKQYFNDLFKDQIGGANPRMVTFGINVTGF